MLKLVKDFWRNEDGMGTIEIVVIIAVLVALALLFKDRIGTFANHMMDKFFDKDRTEVPNQLPNG